MRRGVHGDQDCHPDKAWFTRDIKQKLAEKNAAFISGHFYGLRRHLQQCSIPVCFKTSTIISISKKSKIYWMNNYHPVALTSVAMKVFEHIVLKYLKTATDGLLDPHQFAYLANRSADDTVALGLPHILKHLEQPATYARILFIDFSSAFNTINPYKLLDKLSLLNVHPAVCHWVLNCPC